jgi:hypothetical protein
MNKIFAIALAISLAAVAQAATPGSYAPITLSLSATLTKSMEKKNSDGTYTYTYSTSKKTINNTTVLTELQKKQRIPAGSLRGWALYAVMNVEGEYMGVIAKKSTQAAFADSVIIMDLYGVAETGAVKVTSSGKLVSGSSKQTAAGFATLSIGGVYYDAGASFTGSHTITKVNTAVTVAKPSPFKSTSLVGAGEDGSVLSGSIMTGTATVSSDLGKVFPGL